MLAALLATVVPVAGWRRRNAHRLVGPVADAVLGNARWPLAEQAEVIGGASVEAVLRWAARTDPDAPEVAAAHDLLHVRVDPPTAPPLTELPVHVVREAVLRWPVVARLALALSSCRAWAAVAAVTDDAGTLAWLVDRGARTVDPIDGAPLLEALWCNPTLPTDIRRRLLRVIVAGRVRCHYARPTPELDRPDLAEPTSASHARAETVLQWAERALDVRHLTTWAVARVLAQDVDLTEDQLERALRLLDRDGVAAGLSRPTIAWLRERRGAPSLKEPARAVRRGLRGSGPVPGRIDPVAGRLAALLGDDQDAWDVAIALLRDGWDDTAGRLARTAQAVVAPAR